MDFIDADEAMKMLGCDVDALNSYISNGTLRAQEDAQGNVSIAKDDVVNLMDGSSVLDSDDGTIVLAGDSEELQIDLDDIDDDAMTVVHTNDDNSSLGDTGSITFDDDDLEVADLDVESDGNGSSELSFDDADVTQDLSFTDDDISFTDDIEVTDDIEATEGSGESYVTEEYAEADPQADFAESIASSQSSSPKRPLPTRASC